MWAEDEVWQRVKKNSQNREQRQKERVCIQIGHWVLCAYSRPSEPTWPCLYFLMIKLVSVDKMEAGCGWYLASSKASWSTTTGYLGSLASQLIGHYALLTWVESEARQIYLTACVAIAQRWRKLERKSYTNCEWMDKNCSCSSESLPYLQLPPQFQTFSVRTGMDCNFVLCILYFVCFGQSIVLMRFAPYLTQRASSGEA